MTGWLGSLQIVKREINVTPCLNARFRVRCPAFNLTIIPSKHHHGSFHPFLPRGNSPRAIFSKTEMTLINLHKISADNFEVTLLQSCAASRYWQTLLLWTIKRKRGGTKKKNDLLLRSHGAPVKFILLLSSAPHKSPLRERRDHRACPRRSTSPVYPAGGVLTSSSGCRGDAGCQMSCPVLQAVRVLRTRLSPLSFPDI